MTTIRDIKYIADDLCNAIDSLDDPDDGILATLKSCANGESMSLRDLIAQLQEIEKNNLPEVKILMVVHKDLPPIPVVKCEARVIENDKRVIRLGAF